MLGERGWLYFVEWSPDRKDPLHSLVAVLCLFPDQERAQALLAGGAHEPIRSVLTWLSEGHTDVTSMPAPDCWAYDDPEHKAGYDTQDVVSQLLELGRTMQDTVDDEGVDHGPVDLYLAAQHRHLCTQCAEWLSAARASTPDRVRARLQAVYQRLGRELARIAHVAHVYNR